jgi:hypothetical protein
MSWTDKVGALLNQYSGGSAAAAQPAPDVHAHYDEVSQAVPTGTLADGLAAAFKSDRTPALGQILGRLFSQSNGEQKAGLLNHLIASINPSTLMQAISGTSLAGLLSGGGRPQISEAEAQQVSPKDVEQLAAHAQNNPSLVDSVSNFYAEHKTLVKTLGGGALAIVLARIAEKQRESGGP